MKKLVMASFLFGLISALSHADVSNTFRQFTAPCELSPGELSPVNEMNIYIREGFKLVSLTKAEKPVYFEKACVYTFVRQ